MDHIELPFVKMSTNAVTPTRATEGSAGLDFYSPANYIIPPYSQLLITIDPNYTGEVKVLLINTATHAHSIIRGDPIAQLILEKVSFRMLKRVKELPPTTRGEQGCGS